MPNKIQCATHGECDETFVCSHLVGGSAGLGFNRAEPSEDSPFPDAWCDDCDVIYEAHDGWSDETEGLISIQLLCSGCYEKSRIRNTRTAITLDDLQDFRWKCYSCEEWHTGPCLDFCYDAPAYWGDGVERTSQSRPLNVEELPNSFLDEDLCIVDGEYHFVRGLIQLPIIGTAETFRWGVWGSLSKKNFVKLLSQFDDPKRVELEPMFSWLSNEIDEYEDTLSLKMYAHIREPGEVPLFELEQTDHQLSREYHHGITPTRVKDIMRRRLKETG
jgi:hypothetical protein